MPHGTFQDKVLIPGTIATRSYLFLIPFPLLKSSLSQLTIRNLICTLSDRLGYHGVATRAQAIFDSITQRLSIKWGKAAKLAAAAAVVFAMREQGRGDRTHYVAVSTSFPLFSLSIELAFRVVSPRLDALWLWLRPPIWAPLRGSSWAQNSRQAVFDLSPSRRWLMQAFFSFSIFPLSFNSNANHEQSQLTHYLLFHLSICSQNLLLH